MVHFSTGFLSSFSAVHWYIFAPAFTLAQGDSLSGQVFPFKLLQGFGHGGTIVAGAQIRHQGRTRQLSLASYDRLFPNQDTTPKGGFGNLIALPLQKQPRESGAQRLRR